MPGRPGLAITEGHTHPCSVGAAGQLPDGRQGFSNQLQHAEDETSSVRIKCFREAEITVTIYIF